MRQFVCNHAFWVLQPCYLHLRIRLFVYLLLLLFLLSSSVVYVAPPAGVMFPAPEWRGAIDYCLQCSHPGCPLSWLFPLACTDFPCSCAFAPPLQMVPCWCIHAHTLSAVYYLHSRSACALISGPSPCAEPFAAEESKQSAGSRFGS